jgi:hypothetical protein
MIAKFEEIDEFANDCFQTARVHVSFCCGGTGTKKINRRNWRGGVKVG